jgi:hypothetical protein
MKRFVFLFAIVAVVASGVSLLMYLLGSSPSTNLIMLSCSDSVGQQGHGGERVVGGVEGLASIHRGGDVKRRIGQNFGDWNIFGGALVDHLSDGRVESICR